MTIPAAIQAPAEAKAEAESEFEQTKTILDERARVLGQVREQDNDGPTLQALVFRLGDELYAAAIDGLSSVEYVDELVPLPCTPDFVAGVMNLRGEVISVLSLAVVLGTHASVEPNARVCVVVSESSGFRVGWHVDEVLRVESFALDDLVPSVSGREATLGVALAEITLLDLRQLMASDRFKVTEEVT